MIVIGIYDDHNASAALCIDGEIVFAAQEERFTGRKNEEAFPRYTIEHILKTYKIRPEDIDEIAIAGIHHDYMDLMMRKHSVFTIRDYIEEMERYWKPKLSGAPFDKDYNLNLYKTQKRFQHADDVYEYPESLLKMSGTEQLDEFNRIRKKSISRFLGIPEDKIRFYDHHSCHIYYGYYSNPRKQNPTIGFTIDAFGDNRNQTVWKIEGDRFELLADTKECELARIYRTVTLYLGMRPYEHEYKVMGLAPYAKEEHAQKVCDELSDVARVDGMRIVHKNRPRDLFQFMKDRFQYYRFDNVAAGVQMWLENTAVELLKNIHKETGIRNYVFSGGVAMNVKLNKVLAEQEFVDDFFVCGSSADESLSIGVAYMAARARGVECKPINHLYLGPPVDQSAVAEFVKEEAVQSRYEVRTGVTNKEVAAILAAGNVVARVAGRMEFGARALGNRSILANPGKEDVVKEINEMIKKRDFWMPFALSVLDSYADRYIENPKGLQARFMANAFDTKPEHYERFRAGTHPYDRSVRPQVVTKDANPQYYNLIEEFAAVTGTGALLNTSLNLHGLPLVNDHRQAFHVLDNSGLDYLLIEDVLLVRKKASRERTI